MDKIIIAFEGSRNGEKISTILENQGLRCIRCHTGDQIRRMVEKQHIYTVLCGYKLLEETAEQIFGDLPDYCNMLVLASASRLEFIQEEAIYRLSAPVDRADLLEAVEELVELGRRRERAERPQRSEADNALIQQAKQLLMTGSGWSEEQAHRYLQKYSMDHGERLTDTARRILQKAESHL